MKSDMSQKYLKALSFFREKKYKKALPFLKKINKSKEFKTLDSLQYEAICLGVLGNFNYSSEVWKEALKYVQNDQDKLNIIDNIVQCYRQTGNFDQVIRYLIEGQSVDSSIERFESRLLLCQFAQQTNQLHYVEEYAPLLLTEEKYEVSAHYLLLLAALDRQDKEGALDTIDRIVSFWDALSDAQYFSLISTVFQIADFAKARSLFDMLPKKCELTSWYNLLKAMVYFHCERDYSRVVNCLQVDKIKALDDWEKEAHAKHLLAATHNKLNNHLKSYELYSEVALHYHKQYKKFKTVNYIPMYQRVIKEKRSLPSYSFDRPQPVFMLGFPRSGTTLLETIMDTQCDLVTLSEKDTLSSVQKEITRFYAAPSFIHCLNKLTESDIDRLREVYFSTVDNVVSGSLKGKTLIDKMPINTIHLPLIELLFPEAKVLFNVRHPLDVCLSNLQQIYPLNNEMACLTTMESCVSRYDEVMTYYQEIEPSLSLDILQVRYEDLVADIDVVCENIFLFLGISFNGDYKHFYQNAQNRLINTPSVHQVTKPIYDTSIYKWRKYEPVFDQYLNKLRRHIEYFGYDV